MPTYEYACKSCGERLEVVQSFSDDALTTCPSCEGELRKVYSAAGIIFKGSGWHIKDYSSKGGSSTTAPASGSDSSDGGSSDSGSSEKGASKDGGSSTKKDGASTKKKDGASSSSSKGSTTSNAASD